MFMKILRILFAITLMSCLVYSMKFYSNPKINIQEISTIHPISISNSNLSSNVTIYISSSCPICSKFIVPNLHSFIDRFSLKTNININIMCFSEIDLELKYILFNEQNISKKIEILQNVFKSPDLIQSLKSQYNIKITRNIQEAELNLRFDSYQNKYQAIIPFMFINHSLYYDSMPDFMQIIDKNLT